MRATWILWTALCVGVIAYAQSQTTNTPAPPTPAPGATTNPQPNSPAAKAPANAQAVSAARDLKLRAALTNPTQQSCLAASPPRNGIFVDSVKVYDEASLEGLLNGAKANLAALNAFDQTTLVSHLGGIQGSTIAQSQNTLQVTGPSQLLGSGATVGATPNNPTVTAPTAPAFSAPSAFGTSAGDVLSEAMQLSSQIIGYQLLLEGALNDQFYPGSNRLRNRVTLGIPVNIMVPKGYKYQGAVAEVEVAMCSNAPQTPTYDPPSLAMLLPQDKTYNVASLVSKSSSIGGGLIAGVVNVGGGFLRARQSYYLVQDQDTVATQRPQTFTCPNGRPPVTFAWQFRPVLGQKVVRDGLRRNYAQVSFPQEVPAILAPAAVNAVATLRTSWRRYDASTGRVGDYLDTPEETNLCVPSFSNPPTPASVRVQDNGDGTVNVVALGAFRIGTRVRIGNTVLDQTAPGFEQTQRYIRFNTPALTAALYGAQLVNRDGAEANLVKDLPAPPGAAAALPIPGLPPFAVAPSTAAAGGTVSITIRSSRGIFYSAGMAAVTDLTSDNCHLTFSNRKVVDANTLTVDVTIPLAAAPGAVDLTVKVGAAAFKAARVFNVTASAAIVEAFSDSLSRIHFYPPCRGDASLPDVAVLGSKVYGLRDAPFYLRAPDDEISILVPNDQLRLYRTILWKRLFTEYERAEYNIAFPPAAPAGVSDFSVTNIALLSYTASGSGAGTPTVASSDITVNIPLESVTGTARFAIGNGIPVVFAADPAVAHQGETMQVALAAAFTHFTGATTLLFSNPGVAIAAPGITLVDGNHLKVNLAIAPAAAAGAVNITAVTGNEIAVGPSIFNVSDAPMITAVTPAAGAAGAAVPVIFTGMGTHFVAGSTKLTMSNATVTVTALAVASPTQITATLNIPAAFNGTLSLKAVTGAETAVSRPLFVAGSGSPDILTVTPAAGQPGQSLPGVTIVGSNTNFTAASKISFSNPNIKARNVTWVNATHLTADLDLDAGAASAPATASSAGKPTNTYAITGSRLKDVKILVPANVSLDLNKDTLVTFSLTDDQAKVFKSIVLQHNDDMPQVVALPAAPGGATPAPAKPSIKPATAVPPGTPSITLTGTGMSQVVSVRYLDQPLPFNTKGDTSLTITQLPALTPPAIELVFVYVDKSLAPFAIPVQAPGPK